MGIAFSKLWDRLFSKGNFKIVIIGLDNAGKTTTLYKLSLGDVVATQPTIGSNVEQIVYKNIKFECWDLGGQESLRNSWKTYFLGAHAVVLVVDSTDRERVGVVRAELQGLVALEALASAVVLVFANKQDLHDAMSAAEITEALALSAVRSHEWHIQACCALTGEGLTEGLEWIARRLCA